MMVLWAARVIMFYWPFDSREWNTSFTWLQGKYRNICRFLFITKTTGQLRSELCDFLSPFCYGLSEPRQNAKVICEIRKKKKSFVPTWQLLLSVSIYCVPRTDCGEQEYIIQIYCAESIPPHLAFHAPPGDQYASEKISAEQMWSVTWRTTNIPTRCVQSSTVSSSDCRTRQGMPSMLLSEPGSDLPALSVVLILPQCPGVRWESPDPRSACCK